jgi:glycosyltransferase involved in cell wall biosynthesis
MNAPRVGFLMEQALGHVAYGLGLREALARRTDLECVWLDIPFGPGRFGKLPLVGRNWTLRGSLRARRAGERASRGQPFDALFIHTQTIALFSASRMASVPTLLSLDATPLNYDELSHAYRDPIHAAPIERAKLWAHRTVMRNARRFTCWSEWAKASLVRDYEVAGEKVTVIHPGTVVSKFPDPSARARREGGPLRVLFVGGDFERKGGDLLLDVWRRELRDTVELHLVTSKTFPAEPNLFTYQGVKPYSPELLQLYAQSDVFVLPTRGDCLAMVLGEAMAACLPIITTRVGAHAEAVEDQGSGFLLDVDDARTLVERLKRLAADRELAFRMGQRARRIGEERFDMHKNANRIADLMLDMIGRARAAG